MPNFNNIFLDYNMYNYYIEDGCVIVNDLLPAKLLTIYTTVDFLLNYKNYTIH